MSLPKQPILTSLTPSTRLLFAFLLMVTCFAITFFLALLLAGPIVGVSVTGILASLSDFSDPKSVKLLEYFQVVQSVGLFILPPLLAGFLYEGNAFRFLKMDSTPNWKSYLVTIILMAASLPFINWLVSMNESMVLPSSLKWMEAWMKETEDQAAKLTDLFMKMPGFGSFLFNLVMIAILPAIGEELVFRGLLQKLLRDWLKNIHLATFLFSAMHMQFYGFVPRMVLGLILGYLFYFSGSLWVPVLAHFIQNGSVVVVSWLGQRGVISGNYEDFGTTSNGWIIATSLIVTLGALWVVRFFGEKKGSRRFTQILSAN